MAILLSIRTGMFRGRKLGMGEDSSAVESECNFSFEGNRSCCSNNKQLASQSNRINVCSGKIKTPFNKRKRFQQGYTDNGVLALQGS